MCCVVRVAAELTDQIVEDRLFVTEVSRETINLDHTWASFGICDLRNITELFSGPQCHACTLRDTV